jgi:hypothetical protein
MAQPTKIKPEQKRQLTCIVCTQTRLVCASTFRRNLSGKCKACFNKTFQHTQKRKQELSAWATGRRMSEKSKHTLSVKALERYKTTKHPMLGKKISLEARKKMSESKKRLVAQGWLPEFTRKNKGKKVPYVPGSEKNTHKYSMPPLFYFF